MYRQQLYGSYAERLYVLYNFTREALIGAAPFLRQLGMKLGVAAQVNFVDNCMLPRDGSPLGLAFPVEIRVDDDAFGHEGRAVALVEGGVVARFQLITKYRRVPGQVVEMPAGIGIEHQFVGIEPVSVARLVRTIDAIAVDRAGMHIRHIAVPDLVGVFR